MGSEQDSNIEKPSLRQTVAFYLEDTKTKIGLFFDLSILGFI